MIDINEYLKHPDRCPYCGGNVAAGDTDFSDVNAYRNIKCTKCDCGKEWTEVFTIVSVDEQEG